MVKPKTTWKSVESRIAKWFGTRRTPLSGGNSGHTRSDTLHKKYFIEIKHRAKWAVFELWKETMEMSKKENKMPFLCLHEKSKEGWMICVFSKDWKDLIEMEYKRLFVDKVNLCDICKEDFCSKRNENDIIVDCTEFK